MKTKEEIKKRKHEYYLKNKERFLAYNRKRRELNSEAMKNYSRKYYNENKDKWKEYNDVSKSEEKKEKRLDCIRRLKRNYGQSHKRELILRKGGKCQLCGISYNGKNAPIFDFHHINPEEKDFNISTRLRYNSYIPQELYSEIDKCILVCSNCHRQIHSEEY